MKTLILNSDGMPLKVTDWKEAFLLVYRGRAEPIYFSDKIVKSGKDEYFIPKVVRRKQFIRQEHLKVPLTKKNVLLRDKHKCQYCGSFANTVDHIVPKVVLKEKKLYDTWENLVACCKSCNRRKGEQTWTPQTKPKKPTRSELINIDGFYS